MNKRMKQAREQHNLSMTKVAEMIGISDSAYSRLEKGVNNPSKRTVELFCQKLRISESWLRTGEGEMEEKDLLTDLAARYSLGPAGQALLRAAARVFAEFDEETAFRLIDDTIAELQAVRDRHEAVLTGSVPEVPAPQSPADSDSSVS